MCKETRTGMKVLIVDDDKNSGESLRDIIQYRGHSVTLLDEGMKFVNRMNEETFDIIFMDYHTNEINEMTDVDQSFDTNALDYSQHVLESDDNSNSHRGDRIISMMGSDSDVVDDEDTISDYTDEDESDGSINSISGEHVEEITGTYVTNLARECYDFDTPVFAYTGDSSTDAIKDFQDSNFKGVFVKPVDAQLINSFFEVMEREKEGSDDLTAFTAPTNSKLRRLAMKNNNFIFFKKRRAKVTKTKK
jgi:CheY-like chemotaxis protein